MREHNIVVLKGDGIGPEIVDEAVKVLDAAGKKYGFKMNYDYELMGGCAIDETGEPLPQKTVDACKKADCVFLGAVGGPKWDGVPGNKRPEAGLLGIRGALGLYANLRPARIFAPLKDASPIKDSITEGNLDIMIVRELTGGIYFGERGTGVENGEEYAYDTEKYTELEAPDGKAVFGIGISHNINYASIKGILCAINRCQPNVVREPQQPIFEKKQ